MKLTDSLIRQLPAPAQGNRIIYDDGVKGFGIRVTATGSKSFILNYRVRSTGRERRYTIGEFLNPQSTGGPEGFVALTAARAREVAKALKHEIQVLGRDPLDELQKHRTAPTLDKLCDRFEREFLSEPKDGDESRARRRKSTRRDYSGIIRRHIKPSLGHLRVVEVSFSDVERLHARVTSSVGPYAANRTAAVLSRMFSLAIKWRWCDHNPVKGLERNPEEQRKRYLSANEIKSFMAALANHPDQQAANIFRLLLLTGARRGEVQAARWEQFDLDNGVWTKPASTTKQRREHTVPLSPSACRLLTDIQELARQDARACGRSMSEFVFPGRNGGHRVEIKRAWRAVCLMAGITTSDDDGSIPSLRPHDLRHSFASILASGGLSLPMIGALLGHSQPATTARYAHLLLAPLRQAALQASLVIEGPSQSADRS